MNFPGKLFLLLTLFIPAFSLADSPLTSTEFWKAYENEEILQAAEIPEGRETERVFLYLYNDNPIDVKMALINRLGWNINGTSRAVAFHELLVAMGEPENPLKLKADHLLCLAYLKAMDDYFDVSEALKWAELAEQEKPGSFTFRIIAGLIRAQHLMDTSWCSVFASVDSVRKNSGLEMDFKPGAAQIIYDYTDLYGQYCEQD